jgi:small subunit ribosomal protein S20
VIAGRVGSIMPQHKSAAKRVRQDAKRRLHNRYQKVRVRTLIKDLRETTDSAEAEAKLGVVKAHLDRLAARRVVHPNNAANTKSKLERYVRSLA